MAQHQLFLAKQMNEMVNKLNTQITENNNNFTSLIAKQDVLTTKLDENIMAVTNSGDLYVKPSDNVEYLDTTIYDGDTIGWGGSKTIFEFKISSKGGIRIKADTRTQKSDGTAGTWPCTYKVLKNGTEVYSVSATGNANWIQRVFDLPVDKDDLLTIASSGDSSYETMEIKNWSIYFDISTTRAGVKV